ncbi:TfoX/Sxy family protein [Pseudooceanicola algae]|uniref:TfoX N-terminal domain-containing protein n=1 Tax=Pseudooceanicola algae TaxID=1537215 RepID=A0A418SEZ5_9RHOB|nr:TfoX/Sxy family protein [Pseudooceanicola algae]QPM89342.1 hypothetical protein PSAL_005570 [Pseudooceanicola algae]
MAVDPDFLDHVLDLFSGLGALRTGRMFSGVGIYAEEGAMFAMISGSGAVLMKSDDSTEAAYVAAGSTPFSYERKTGTREVRSLMSLPESALDDPEEAMAWARISLAPARVAAAEKRQAKARAKARTSKATTDAPPPKARRKAPAKASRKPPG